MNRLKIFLSYSFHYLEETAFLRLPTLLAIRFSKWFGPRLQSGGRKSILIVRLDGIGDCVLSLPLFEQLKACFPEAAITLIVQQAPALLLGGSPLVEEIIVWQPRSVHRIFRRAADLCLAIDLYWRRLRGRTFDIVINPRWDADTAPATFLCALAAAPVKIGYEDATCSAKLKWNSGFQGAFSKVVAAGPLQHEVLRNLAIGKVLGCTSDGLLPRLDLSPQEREAARSWFKDQGTSPRIALGLPAAAAKRRWSAAKYISALRMTNDRAEFIPILIADNDTEHVAKAIKEAFPQAQLSGNIALRQIAAILAECDVFLGSDSGLAHIAAAVGCRTIILSPHPRTADPGHYNSPLRFLPCAPRAVALQPESARQGCEAACVSEEAHCILDIDPALAFQAMLSMLEADQGDAGAEAIAQPGVSPASLITN